ncbi:hypothetical protein PRIPAC_97844 [Pristionchus pacificus]|uniref:C2H2-type domain-containing protein n=1 Tax=Pristionchus pacificus TaxID=54126 RepID=A0A2A6D0V4_PRIPA|nr:hypothetical protein PRIPAC_97844 [Pristionchus pacificus]|eukprot:PDM84019.1 hypothetical protein PRIPAC_34211 [Pristionchus pacificus]
MQRKKDTEKEKASSAYLFARIICVHIGYSVTSVSKAAVIFSGACYTHVRSTIVYGQSKMGRTQKSKGSTDSTITKKKILKKTSAEDLKFQCMECDKRVKSPHGLSRHVKSMHRAAQVAVPAAICVLCCSDLHTRSFCKII